MEPYILVLTGNLLGEGIYTSIHYSVEDAIDKLHTISEDEEIFIGEGLYAKFYHELTDNGFVEYRSKGNMFTVKRFELDFDRLKIVLK